MSKSLYPIPHCTTSHWSQTHGRELFSWRHGHSCCRYRCQGRRYMISWSAPERPLHFLLFSLPFLLPLQSVFTFFAGLRGVFRNQRFTAFFTLHARKVFLTLSRRPKSYRKDDHRSQILHHQLRDCHLGSGVPGVRSVPMAQQT